MGEPKVTNRTWTATIPGDSLPHVVINPVAVPTEVIFTCGFGAATVEFSMRENGLGNSWTALPALSVPYTKRLNPGDMILMRSDLDVRVPISTGEVP